MSRSKTIKRYKGERPPGPGALVGRYDAGILNERFAAMLGQILATWVHIEDLMVQVLQDLLGGKRAPARQIFHSILSNHSRKSVMLACLERSAINSQKGTLYDSIISQFSTINSMRNKFVHGLWYTHESGRVFLSERAVEDFHWADAKEVSLAELEAMNVLMAELSIKIQYRKSPKLVEAVVSSRETVLQSETSR